MTAQEWLDSLDRARDIAMTQPSAGPYSGEEAFRDVSAYSSHSNTLDRTADLQDNTSHPPTRNTLVKHQNDTESVKGKKRFSRRHSKNGLAAVF